MLQVTKFRHMPSLWRCPLCDNSCCSLLHKPLRLAFIQYVASLRISLHLNFCSLSCFKFVILRATLPLDYKNVKQNLSMIYKFGFDFRHFSSVRHMLHKHVNGTNYLVLDSKLSFRILARGL